MSMRMVAACLLAFLLVQGGPIHAQPSPVQSSTATPAPARSAPIPYKKDKEGAGSLAYQSFAGLILAGLAAYGIVLGLKKLKFQSGSVLRKERRLTLRESVRLSRRSVLHVVDYNGAELLFAESEQGLSLVSPPAPGAVNG